MVHGRPGQKSGMNRGWAVASGPPDAPNIELVPFAKANNTGRMDVAFDRAVASRVTKATWRVATLTVACADSVWEDLSEDDTPA